MTQALEISRYSLDTSLAKSLKGGMRFADIRVIADSHS
jgi:hypothetical protein